MTTYPPDLPPAAAYRHCPLCTGELADAPDAYDGRTRPTCPDCGWQYIPRNPVAALAVVETDDGLLFTHPEGGPAEAPAALPALFLEYGDTPESGLLRAVPELTGVEIEIVEELIRFQQPGTPFGTGLMFGFRARAIGGDLTKDGREGPAVIHPYDALPRIIPVRLANIRVFEAYLARTERAV